MDDALVAAAIDVGGRAFFVGGSCTIADIALYAYTHVAPEGGFDLGGFPQVCAWIERIRGRPGYVPIIHTSD